MNFNKMLRWFVSLITIYFIMSNGLFSQTVQSQAISISTNVGIFATDRENFSEGYNSRTMFAFGGSITLPVANRSSLYLNLSYFQKSGMAILYTYEIQNGELTRINETKQGTAEFKELIISPGLQHYFEIDEVYNLGINAGIFLIQSSETTDLGDSYPQSQSTAKGFGGFVLGLSGERFVMASSLAFFCQTEYYFTHKPIGQFSGNYGGLKLCTGLRYYFR